MKLKLPANEATNLMICATQLLWLSQAWLLHKMRQKFAYKLTPQIWLAYLMSLDGGHTAAQLNAQLQSWLLANVSNADWDPYYVIMEIKGPLQNMLEKLTKDVFFVVDEAQAALSLFETLPFVKDINSER